MKKIFLLAFVLVFTLSFSQFSRSFSHLGTRFSSSQPFDYIPLRSTINSDGRSIVVNTQEAVPLRLWITSSRQIIRNAWYYRIQDETGARGTFGCNSDPGLPCVIVMDSGIQVGFLRR